MKRFLLLAALCAIAYCAMAQVGTKFSSKDKFGNTLWYEIISDSEVKLTNKVGNGSGNKPYVKMKKVAIPNKVSYKGHDFTLTQYDGAACFSEAIAVNFSVVGYKSSLEYLEFSDDISAIYGSPFDGCVSLTTIILPKNLKVIGKYAFSHCSALREITIPNGVTSIGEYAFRGCPSLKVIIIPNTVTTIGKGAFNECESLEEVSIPSSVTSIGDYAFYHCQSLHKVTGLHAGIALGKDCFSGPGAMYSPIDFYRKYRYSFEYCANSHIIPGIKEWQKKRDFETRAQYQERVTKENQDKKVKELLAEAVKEYTGRYENKLKAELGSYDADYEMYKIKTNYGDKFVKVPLSEAPAFKQDFQEAKLDAQYAVVKDGLAISDLAITLNGKRYEAEKSAVELASYEIELPAIEMPYQQSTQQPSSTKPVTVQVDHSIDQNIPTSSANNTNTFAVIIGNEKYSQVAHVPYAGNDARVFAEYCRKTLGLPQKNVKVYENASYGTMIGAVSDIQKIAKAFKGDINVIFYYAGHGIPDEATGDGYLLPIDADGRNMRVCYPLSQLYKELGDMQAKSVTCFMDACFSGAQRGNGMIVAARGVAIKAKADNPAGNAVVFTAATDKQTAYPYEEKGHGMFTYYLLKKLRDTKGDCTLGELGSYVCDEVAKQAIVTNGKEQTPVVLTSQGVQDNWKNWKLR
jgi:hypothetical protein